MKIYLASSWRNVRQNEVVVALREQGHWVYDFKVPMFYEGIDTPGFSWCQTGCDTNDIGGYLDSLQTEIAGDGFQRDWDAMNEADTFVLLLPCGRSAHLEMGWAIGRGKATHIVLSEDKFEPELMYKMADVIWPSIEDFLKEGI